jgi:hypothetical protein
MRIVPPIAALLLISVTCDAFGEIPSSPEPIIVTAGYAPSPIQLPPPPAVTTSAYPPAATVPPACGTPACGTPACGTPACSPPVLLPPPASPTIRYRPVIPVGRPPRSVYLGQGWLGQPKVYVEGQPIRNFFRYLGP